MQALVHRAVHGPIITAMIGTDVNTTEESDPETELRKEYLRLLARRRLSETLHAEATVTGEDIIAEMQANAHGPDLPPQFYEQLRKSLADQLRENEGGRFQPIIEVISAEIRERLTEKGITLPMPVYAGQFPHGSFNAQARPVNGGVLILINSGLFMFIYQMLKIATMATRFTDLNERGQLVKHPKIHDAVQSSEEITRLLTDCVLAYIKHEDSTRAHRLPALGGVRQTLLAMLVHSCEMFTVAHEFGHVIDGHFSDAAPVLDSNVTSYFSKDHLQEYNADQIAAALLIAGVYAEAEALSKQPRIEEYELAQLHLRSMATVAGPFIFFALSDLVDQVRKRVHSVPTSEPAEVSSHPPAPERFFQLSNFFTRNNTECNFEFANGYTGFFTAQIDSIVAEAQRRFGESTPRSQ